MGSRGWLRVLVVSVVVAGCAVRGVEGVTFTYNGFTGLSDLAYPSTRSGMSFVTVPDNVTVGAQLNYPGLLTANGTSRPPNRASDDYKFGVDFDTHIYYKFSAYIIAEFQDLNNTLVGGPHQVRRHRWHREQQLAHHPRLELQHRRGLPARLPRPRRPARNRPPRPNVRSWPPPSSRIPAAARAPGASTAEPPGKRVNLGLLLRSLVPGVVIAVVLFLAFSKVFRRPLHVFLSHAGGQTGGGKNFPSILKLILDKHRWSSWRFRVKVFYDKESLPPGEYFPHKIVAALEEFDVGVVCVTEDFFENHWPMTELVTFVAFENRDRPRKRIYPIFYELSKRRVVELLENRRWHHQWTKISHHPKHPIDVHVCERAVRSMCNFTGIEHQNMSDSDYTKKILDDIDFMLRKERVIASDVQCAKQAVCKWLQKCWPFRIKRAGAAAGEMTTPPGSIFKSDTGLLEVAVEVVALPKQACRRRGRGDDDTAQ